jgi:glutamyl-tRNA reductase
MTTARTVPRRSLRTNPGRLAPLDPRRCLPPSDRGVHCQRGERRVIVVVGLNHETAPVSVREAVAFPREDLVAALGQLRRQTGLGEAMILSTCNRVEVYGRAGAPCSEAVAAFLARYHGQTPTDLDGHLYRLEGGAAVRHAFRVTASLESMVLGEPQILGQVKEAYEAAEDAGSLGPVLGALRNRSIAAARRVRSETAIGRNAVSVSHVAVDLARELLGDLRGRSVLLVGAGKMGEVAARQMVLQGARATLLGGRTLAKAERLAGALVGRAAPFESLRAELAKADVVVSGTGAPGVVIRCEDVEATQRARRCRPLVLIDIAVPRDIEEDAGRVAGVRLYGLDDVRTLAEARLGERRKEAAAAESILEEEIRDFLAWERSLDAVPLVVELRRRADAIREAEIRKARRRLGVLTLEQESALEAATSALVSKLLHGPTVHMKRMAADGHSERLGLVRELFGL